MDDVPQQHLSTVGSCGPGVAYRFHDYVSYSKASPQIICLCRSDCSPAIPERVLVLVEDTNASVPAFLRAMDAIDTSRQYRRLEISDALQTLLVYLSHFT